MAARQRRIGTLLYYVVLAAIILLVLLPVLLILSTSLKAEDEASRLPPSLIPLRPTLGQYARAFSFADISTFLRNSVQVALVTTVLAVIAGSMGGYALSRLRFVGRAVIGQTILLAYMFPGVLLVIPLFLLFSRLGLINSPLSLIVAYTTFALPFAVWMLKGYFDALPVELEEAAMIDGCTRLQTLWQVILPLSVPGLVAVAAFAFILAWGEYLFAITFINSDAQKTLVAGLSTMIVRYTSPDFGLLAAASMIVIVPPILFFLLLQRYIIAGLTAGAVKG